MRYDDPIFFQRVHPGEYDPATGNYAEDMVTEVKKYASVTNAGTETLQLVYGELKQGAKTIRLQRPYTEPFDRIRIGKKIYRVDLAKRISYVVSEVQ